MSLLSIIVPCYGNEDNFPEIFEALKNQEKNFPTDTSFEYIFVDDGSEDNTYLKIETLQQQNKNIKLIRLLHNYGQQIAIYIGLQNTLGDCCAIIAADLQEPPELLPKMFAEWQNGYSLVISNRENNEESIFSSIYHFLMRATFFFKVPPKGFSLVLMDKSIKNLFISKPFYQIDIFYSLANLSNNFFVIPHKRKKRLIGKSKWSISKKIRLFINSILYFYFYNKILLYFNLAIYLFCLLNNIYSIILYTVILYILVYLYLYLFVKYRKNKKIYTFTCILSILCDLM